MKKIILLIFLLPFLLLGNARAENAFLVKDIQIRGLQRISAATVLTYLPIKKGETLQAGKTDDIIRALYKTGFFDHISLVKQNQTLIIHVVERPIIGQLKISGNSIIPTDKLTGVMKSVDIAEGRIYNQAMLDKIKLSLLNQYYQLGRYNARIDVNVTPLERNRVFVQIEISEGLVSRIKRISLIGNKTFSDKVLVKQLNLSTPGLLTFFTQTDRYSEGKLEESLDKIRNYYLDHGYLRFTVKSSQAEVTPDRKSVYITIVVEEGEQYRVKGFTVKGQTIVPQEEIIRSIPIQSGDVFSRQKIITAEKNISTLLGNQGYVFANITLHPDVNEAQKEVTLEFDVKPGKRAYVHNITFSQNARTNDVVLRREIEQMEAAPVSTAKLEESKHRLSLLPYIKDVEMSVHPVAEKSDQIDVNYKVTEDNSANASFKVGYSQIQRTIFGAGINQKNFFGTGQTLGLNLTHSQLEQYYGIDFTDPYYTDDGVSRTFNFAFSRVDPGAASVNNGFTTNEFDVGVLYGIPVGQEQGAYSRFQFGVGYQNTLVYLLKRDGAYRASEEVLSFVNDHGRRFQEVDIKLGFSRDSRDKAIFPTQGGIQTLFGDAYAPLATGSVAFYTFNYRGKMYFPLYEGFITIFRADLAYGNGFGGINDYPFFKNFYAGGIDSVRGYQFGLGPRDSRDNPFGGNMLVDGSVGLTFPNYLSENLRTSVYFDIGNAYSSLNNVQYGGLNAGPLRYSVGIEADWYTLFGPIQLSLAKPLNPRGATGSHSGDFTEPFQLAIGANF